MHRCGTVLLVLLAISLLITLTGCLGGNTANLGAGGARSISLSPGGTLSLEVGGTLGFSASAIDANGHPIIGADIQFIVSSPPGSTSPPPISLTVGGGACAGTWDASQTHCTAGSPGVAIVTATANGIRSPQATVYVHEHIASLQLSQAKTLPPVYDCFSQGQTWLYQGRAYDTNGTEITQTVGQLAWISSNTGVLTTNTNPPLQIPLPLNQVQITAASPGVTQLTASVSGTSSNPIPLTTCLVQSVRLQVSGTTASSVNVTSGNSVVINATAVDSLGVTLSKPPLTWISSKPEVVSFSSLTNTTGTNSATAHANQGGADISAVCAPPTCNIGVLPNITIPTLNPPYSQQDPSAMPAYVFSSDGPLSPSNPLPGYGAISVNVTNTSLPTYTGWVATDQCGTATNGCTSIMFAATPTSSPGTNPIGTTVILPRTPNSLMFNHQSRIYIGSSQGLMYYDVGGSTGVAEVSAVSSPCNLALCGNVLAISNDGKQVVVSDGSVPATPQVYIYNATSSAAGVTDIALPCTAQPQQDCAASAAAFSSDESKIFILTNAGTMYVYSTTDVPRPVPLPPAAPFGTSAAFSADGSFAYVAGAAQSLGSTGNTGSVSAFSTCALDGAPSTNLGTVSLPANQGAPLQIFPSPILQHTTQGTTDLITQNLYVFEPPLIQALTAQFTQNTNPTPVQPSKYTCNLPALTSFSPAAPPYTVQGGQFTPVYASLVNNGADFIIVARFIPAVIIFNIASQSTTAVKLVNSYDPLSASASSDGSQVFVAACDQIHDPSAPCPAGSVHLVNTINGTDQQVPYINNSTNNMCTGQGAGTPNCFPDLVAIKPQ